MGLVMHRLGEFNYESKIAHYISVTVEVSCVTTYLTLV